MGEAYRYRGALAHLGLAAQGGASAAGDTAVQMYEGPWRVQLNLGGSPSEPKFAQAAKRALGCGLPTRANTVEFSDTVKAMWLGPDEWLLAATPSAKVRLVRAFTRMSANHHLSLTEVSDARAMIVLTGPAARTVLMKGCSLDLHPRVFRAGSCAQSTVALCQVILTQVDDVPSYELYVGRSFADYLWNWLWDAAKEYGIAVGAGETIPQS